MSPREKDLRDKNLNSQKLEHHFNQVKRENYSESFPEVENWLYKANIQLESRPKTVKQNEPNQTERMLHKMKNFFFANKLRLVYTVVALALIVAACNMPVTQTESAGQMITLTVPSENSDFAVKMNALPWIKDAQVSANENTNNGVSQMLYTVILPNATNEQAKNYSKELESLGGVTTIRIMPMDYDVERPLYSAALDNLFSIKVDATGLSDEQLKQTVEKQLREQGVNMEFNVKTDADGKRRITLENLEGDKINGPQNVQLDINDENGKEKLRIVTQKGDPDKFKNKTDNEIKEMIMKENPDIKESEIKITREGDKVQVKVQADRDVKK